MRVLIWNTPWLAQGDLLFYRNCFVKHLAVQANTLAAAGVSVDVVMNDTISYDSAILHPRVKQVHIDLMDLLPVVGSFADPSTALYKGSDPALVERIAGLLASKLPGGYDVVLLWETPVPFLEELFSDALIVHQMPGAFSRAPYPHTVVFDPVGLYRQGALYQSCNDVLLGKFTGAGKTSFPRDFENVARSIIGGLQPVELGTVVDAASFSQLMLLPLQVSGHYAFQADTPYLSQLEYLVDTMRAVCPDTGVLVTQYVTPRVSDVVMSEETTRSLRCRWGNILYNPIFDRIGGVSQYLASLVETVTTCSSSIGLQAMLWDRKLVVPHDTFLSPYSDVSIQGMGVDRTTANRNTLEFILRHQQPLFQKVTSDAGFLLPLLEEMLRRKRSGAHGTDLFVPFDQIDRRYGDDLMGSFRDGRAANELKAVVGKASPRHEQVAGFSDIVRKANVKVVSFDVFDTLLNRPTEIPTDVFAFAEREALRISAGALEGFSKIRQSAERAARERSKSLEITLADIYGVIAEWFQLAPDTCERLMDAEMALELQFTSARPTGRRLWDVVVKAGKPIVLVSDMYLPASAVAAMLEKAGYQGYRKLYVSSEYGVKKKDGALFDVVVDDLHCAPESLLHVGDNRLADVEMPRSKGIKTFRVVRAIDNLRANTAYTEIFDPKSGAGEKPRSAIVGLIANVLFDDTVDAVEKKTQFGGSPNSLGYAGIGPMVAAYMLWLGRRAKSDGITKLYFLSREGWLLKQVYDELFRGEQDAVPSAYMYCSRRAARVAALSTPEDVVRLATTAYKGGVLLKDLLLNRFGLAPNARIERLLEANGMTLDEPLSADFDGRARFATICRCLSGEILDVASSEKASYRRYLDVVGLSNEEKPALVDIGWKANMQGALGRVLERPLHAYYYATLQGAELWLQEGHTMGAFAGEYQAALHPGGVSSNRPLAEYLLCHTERSLQCMREHASGFVAVFRSEPGHARRLPFISEVHRGAVQFARDVVARFGSHTSQLFIDPYLAERVFLSFAERPHGSDAAMLMGQSFEDGFGGTAEQYVIAPTREGASVWRAGSDSLYGAAGGKEQAPGGMTASHARPDAEDGRPGRKRVWRRVEPVVIRMLVKGRKYEKYLKDRRRFFLDSKHAAFRRWYAWTE